MDVTSAIFAVGYAHDDEFVAETVIFSSRAMFGRSCHVRFQSHGATAALRPPGRRSGWSCVRPRVGRAAGRLGHNVPVG